MLKAGFATRAFSSRDRLTLSGSELIEPPHGAMLLAVVTNPLLVRGTEQDRRDVPAGRGGRKAPLSGSAWRDRHAVDGGGLTGGKVTAMPAHRL